MIWFTADTHFGHANIIRHCSRPYANAEEMDAALVAAINDRVARADTLWILGDFAYRGRDPAHYRQQIRCRTVRLLLGNHDKRSKCERAGFASVGEVAEITVGGQRIWLSHYAHRSWPASHRGSWHLYGHSHGTLDEDDRHYWLDALDVGVDNGGRYAPWSLDDVAAVLPRDRPKPIAPCDTDWKTRPFWVDPPAGWRYGFPRLYDPSRDGDMNSWLIANGYPEKLASQRLHCTFTAATAEELSER